MRSTTLSTRSRWLESQDEWTKEEWDWFWMGPVEGGTPGMVRRVRRILDVSQRGLAALIGVSQSVVARWETGRTSPRTSVMEDLLRRARLSVTVHDDDGQEVGPMRDDGARQKHGSRFPAHVDLRVTGWWVPGDVESTMIEFYRWQRQSREDREPMVRYRRRRWLREIARDIRGTPDDHPSLEQCAAEAEHLDELWEEGARRPRAA